MVCVALTVLPGAVCGQGNVLMGLDGNFVNNTGAQFGTFNFSNTVGPAADVGRYGAFTMAEPGAGGSALA